MTRPRNLRTDAVIQVAGEMQHKMAKAIAEGKRLGPKLSVAEWRGEFVKHARELCIARCQPR